MNLLIIYTGGTIGMVQNPETGALENLNFDHLQQHVPELQHFGYHIDVKAFNPPIDSSDMTPQHWTDLADIIHKAAPQYDGFVVLHGTDTMAFTASVLSFMLQGLAKPVIITGSQLPISQLRTDGRENLITAVEIAAAQDSEGRPRVPEVCIYFERRLMRGNRATKINAEGFNAFRSHNLLPLATAGTHIRYNSDVILRPDQCTALPFPLGTLNPHIVVVTLFPGMPECLFAAQVSAPELRGVILRTFGSGNAPQQSWLLKQLRQLQERGIVVVNITQCDEGAVDMGRYQTSRLLLEAGVIPGYDSTWECMLMKLMILLGSSLSQQDIEHYLHTSLAGEITLDNPE